MAPIIRAGMIAALRGLARGTKRVKKATNPKNSKYTKEYDELPAQEDTELRRHYKKLEIKRLRAENARLRKKN